MRQQLLFRPRPKAEITGIRPAGLTSQILSVTTTYSEGVGAVRRLFLVAFTVLAHCPTTPLSRQTTTKNAPQHQTAGRSVSGMGARLTRSR